MRVPGRASRCLLALASLAALGVAAALLVLSSGVRAQEADPDYWQSSNLPQMGLATYYAPGLMDYVHDYRVQRGQLPECPDCVGSVALLRAGDIGRKIWLQPPGGELAGPFLVVDCARPEDVQPLLDRSWVVDVSFDLGQTWGLSGPLDGVIVWADPSEGNAPRPPAQPTLFYIDPRDVVISPPTPTPAAPQPEALPTRVPVPRAGARVATATPEKLARGPTPLTPIVTTPTPAGWVPPAKTEPPAAPGPATAALGGAVPAEAGQGAGTGPTSGGQMRVSFARPGAALLAGGQATPLARVLAVPIATPARLKPKIFPTARPSPTLEAATGATPSQGQGSWLQQIWEALQDLLTPGSAGEH